jgi:hypothetical protein
MANAEPQHAKRQLAKWVDLRAAYARSLPAMK